MAFEVRNMRTVWMTGILLLATMASGVASASSGSAGDKDRMPTEPPCHGWISVMCTYEECTGSGDERICYEYSCALWLRDVLDYACVVGSVGPLGARAPA